MNSKIDVRFYTFNKGDVAGYTPAKVEGLSTGYDVRNAGPDIVLKPFEHALIPLGFKTFIPEGWWLFLVPRSSSHAKKHMHTLYGVIDESYEGEWFFSAQYIPITNNIEQVYVEYDFHERFGYYGENYSVADKSLNAYNLADIKDLEIKRGDAIAQIIVMPRYEMNVISVTAEEYKELTTKRGAARGSGGFGSSDKK